MEFPVEIQMLINDYLRPMTRPDWRQGSFITRHYRSPKGRYGRLTFHEFELYLLRCEDLKRRNEDEEEDSEFYITIKSTAFSFEHRYIKNDKHIYEMRQDEYNNEDEDY
jgi:hypothetical protein